jgi:hypothetical protein
MDYKCLGFDIDKNYGKYVKLVSTSSTSTSTSMSLPLDIRTISGIQFTDFTVLSGKLYEFQFRVKIENNGGNILGLYLEDIYGRWFVCSKDIDNSYFDVFANEWCCHWRVKIPSTINASASASTSAVACRANCLIYIKPEYSNALAELLISKNIQDSLLITSPSTTTASTATATSFSHFHNGGTIFIDRSDTPIEQYLSFMKKVKEWHHNDEKDIKKILSSCGRNQFVCIMNSNLLFHSNFEDTFQNVANYLIDTPVNVIVWSSSRKISLDSQSFKFRSPVSLIGTVPIGAVGAYSLSYLACEVMLKNISSDPNTALLRTLNYFKEKNTAYFCNPGLFLESSTASTSPMASTATYRNIKHGSYDLLLSNLSIDTKVSIVIVIDDCIVNKDEAKECINSICNQSYKNIEILIVNFSKFFPSDDITCDDLRVKIVKLDKFKPWLENLVDVIRDCQGAYIMFQHIKMISTVKRIEKQISVLIGSEINSLHVTSCERGIKSNTADKEYIEKIKSQVNSYELGLYQKSLFRNLFTATSTSMSTSTSTSASMSSFMYMLFRYVSSVLKSRIIIEKDSIIKYSDFPFYFTLPEVLVLN